MNAMISNSRRVLARSCRLTLLALLLLLPALAQAAEFKLVAHPAVPEARLSAADCSRIFLKKHGRWADGKTIVPVDLTIVSPVRQGFTQEIHKRPMSAIEAYWQRMLFTGQGVPPVVLNGDAEVLDYVKGHPGAIGYVSAKATTEGVKLLELD
jgi:hypothetical protein